MFGFVKCMHNSFVMTRGRLTAVLLALGGATCVAIAFNIRRRRRSRTHGAVLAGTWKFSQIALRAAARHLESGATLLDSVEVGIRALEADTADQYFVGVGGLPNRDGVMQMDAALWDGRSNRCGAVMALESTRHAVSVARLVLERSIHNIFVGAGALAFKRECGLPDDEPLTNKAAAEWAQWQEQQRARPEQRTGAHDLRQHDTIGVVGVDEHGDLVAGTSTSGWAFKPAGRVGDSPLFGSGLCVDNVVGAAVATGDGEDIMKAVLTHEVLVRMRRGASPTAACSGAIAQMLHGLPPERRAAVKVGVVAVSKAGEVGAGTTISAANEHHHAVANTYPDHFQFGVWRRDAETGGWSSVDCYASARS